MRSKQKAQRRGSRCIAVACALAASVLFAGCTSSGPSAPTTGAPSADSTIPDFAGLPTLKADFGVDEDLHAMLPRQIQDSGALRVGMAVGLAPINFPGASADQVRGLNDDLATGLEQLLGVEFEREIFPNTAAQLLGLQSGQIDLTISTNGDTRERQESFDFVGYMLATNVLMVMEGNPLGIESAEDLCGSTYGEVKGGASVLAALEGVCSDAGLDAPTLASFEDVPSMQTALVAGRIDGYAGSNFSTQWQQFQGAPIEAVEMPETGTIVLGMTVVKGQEELAAAMLAALEGLQSNGFYDEAFSRWGLDDIKIDPGINIGELGSQFG